MIKHLRQRLAIGSCSRQVWVSVGRQLRARRAHLGIDVKRVALALAISPSIYENYEAGNKQIPALQLDQVAELFGVHVAWFFRDIDFDTDDGSEIATPAGALGVFRVATEEHRLGVLADAFRSLDWEGQQHLLAIAGALSQALVEQRTGNVELSVVKRASRGKR